MKLIRNCTLSYRCPMRWDDLLATDNPKVRQCDECDRNVHLVESQAEFDDQISKGHCIAAFVEEAGDAVNYVGTGPDDRPKYG
jgi:hypothetical protein